MRVIIAFTSLPLVFGLLSLVASLVAHPPDRFSMHSVFDIGYVGLYYLGVAYALTIVVGLPAFIICLRKSWLSWWHAGVGGAAASLVPCIVLGAAIMPTRLHPVPWSDALAEFLEVALPFLFIGVIHGLLFWVLGIWRNQRLTTRSTGRLAGGASRRPLGAG